MKPIINYVLGIMLLPILLTSCNSEKSSHKEENKFEVSTPLVKDTVVENKYVSQIKSYQHIELRALERGYLQEIYVDEGAKVKKGTLLFKIMPMLYEAEAKKAQSELEFATIEYENTAALAQKNVVSKNELALAKAKQRKAEAELAIANLHLKFTEVRAPFDGIIDKFLVRKGSLLEEGELLTNLADNSKVWVYYNVPEAEYLNYSMNKNVGKEVVLLELANKKNFNEKGIVETIEADFDNETGNIAFRATFPNPTGILRHGETGKIISSKNYQNALIIPQKATYEVLDKKYVYVIDKDNKAHAREIEVAAELPHLYIIKSGLNKNDKFLVDGISLVKENQDIQFTFLQPKELYNNLTLYAE